MDADITPDPKLKTIKIVFKDGEKETISNVVRCMRSDGFLDIMIDNNQDGIVEKTISINLDTISRYEKF